MIIYGYRNKNIEGRTGTFACPNCGEQRVFKHIRIVRYFTLFFIQLFPLGKVSEYIQCQTCRKSYPITVISAEIIKSLTASEQKKSSGALSKVLIFLGTIGLLLGCMAIFILVAFQIDNPDNWLGFFALVALCPAPLTLVGLVMFFAGLRLRRNGENSNQDDSNFIKGD
jgi:DNA-directed RNA polymerase subunit RPC12/RpoP